MTDSRVAVGLDRLPWLDDEPKARVNASVRELLGWAVAAMLLVAGISYWLGTRNGRGELPEAPIEHLSERSATVKLPEPRIDEVAPDLSRVPAPVVRAPELKVESRASPAKRERASPQPVKEEIGSRAAPSKAASVPARPVATARSRYPALWPASESKGAYGRVVRIGAFGSRQQAKLGWRQMQRAYPAVGRLPATVITDRNSRGRRFYRFQIGTTSQAHSEVLCQRMQKIRLSCAVVGLPWKPRGVER
ncbi:MAG TPA: hypothetical protein VFY95_05900 [Sphingomicrobium sp.]